MKQSFKAYIRDVRNLMHVLIGFTAGYDITFLVFRNFPISWEYWNNAFSPLIGAIVVYALSFKWEKYQDTIKEGSSDMRDVYVSAISALLGGCVSLFCPSTYFALSLTIVSSVVFIKELIINLKLYKMSKTTFGGIMTVVGAVPQMISSLGLTEVPNWLRVAGLVCSGAFFLYTTYNTQDTK